MMRVVKREQSLPVLRFRSPGPEATQAAAHELAAGIDEHGLVIGLVGALGTGKTLFVKGLAAGMGIDPSQVSSPTFVIAQQTVAASGRRLAHVDLYRVSSLGELEVLTPRELEILALIGHGLAIKEIAAILHRSPRTVEAHKQAIAGKLQETDRVKLARIALEAGLLIRDAARTRLRLS